MNRAPPGLYDSLPLFTARKSIRVLHLDDGIPESPMTALRGSMRVVDLIDKPVFTALSYVWGAYHSPPHEIICDGFAIKITSNCRAALCALKRNFGPIVIWVDAICMNQQDEKEKETQIPLMGDIYSLAASAYIWLGEETPDSKFAIDYLRSAGFQRRFGSTSHSYYVSPPNTWVHWDIARSLFARRCRDFIGNWWRYGFLSGIGTLWAGVQGPPDGLIHSGAFEDFFEREWAYRVWTLQEIILAKNPIICCGPEILEWDSVVYGIAYLEHATQRYGVSMPEVGFNVWRSIVLLWLFVNPEGQNRDQLLDSPLTSEITIQRFMPEYWEFLEAITQRHRRLAVIALCIHIGIWIAILVSIRFSLGLETFGSGVAGSFTVLVAFVFIGISVADPVFRWPVGYPRDIVKRVSDVPNSVLHELCARQATNPRDKFFGMYAIFTRLDIRLRPSEYSRTPEEVHRDAFLALLSWTDSLSLLLCSGDRKSDYNSSWVPDWGRDLTQEWFDPSHLFRKGDHDATPLSNSLWSLRDGKELVLKGAVISSIAQQTEPFPFIDDEAVSLRYDQPILENALRTLKVYYQWGNPMLTRFSRPHKGHPNEPRSTLALDMSVLNLSYWLEILNSLARNERLLFQTLIPGRKSVGTCPKNAKVGDLIALASGLPLPLVLRPEGDSYRFIGFAEVDGLMKGEMWTGLNDDDLMDLVLI
ncbi:heterokaryon incompatibility protein-domain-containing protein [Hypomontagnella monticulosa]|nr:heterokaryon incompatibility protein-domain-containing protein [Hypomontagnella monticulosa]